MGFEHAQQEARRRAAMTQSERDAEDAARIEADRRDWRWLLNRWRKMLSDAKKSLRPKELAEWLSQHECDRNEANRARRKLSETKGVTGYYDGRR